MYLYCDALWAYDQSLGPPPLIVSVSQLLTEQLEEDEEMIYLHNKLH